MVEVALQENGIHNASLIKMDELEDVSGRSDTDTSRADGSVTDDKPAESKPVKKFAASKPISFAKYSVPKVIAANAAVKGTDKGNAPSVASPGSTRPRGGPCEGHRPPRVYVQRGKDEHEGV